jgi:trimethylamine--corrinoid protein Co-methyltransferase
MAGSLVMKLAEQLAALCIVQTIRPGSPCLMDWGHIKLDMRTAEIEEAGPEYPIGTAVGAQLSRRYGIPSYSCPASDSKIADFQAGFEMAETLHTALLSGIQVTVNAGTASRCSAASYELLVLHNEMLRNMKRVRRGMTVNDETLALDVQREVGFGGEYLTHPHTLQHIRRDEEYLHKDLFDSSGTRMPYQDPLDEAQERWERILLEREVAVTESDIKAIDQVVADFMSA